MLLAALPLAPAPVFGSWGGGEDPLYLPHQPRSPAPMPLDGDEALRATVEALEADFAVFIDNIPAVAFLDPDLHDTGPTAGEGGVCLKRLGGTPVRSGRFGTAPEC